jgi:hypothetical protein
MDKKKSWSLGQSWWWSKLEWEAPVRLPHQGETLIKQSGDVIGRWTSQCRARTGWANQGLMFDIWGRVIYMGTMGFGRRGFR